MQNIIYRTTHQFPHTIRYKGTNNSARFICAWNFHPSEANLFN